MKKLSSLAVILMSVGATSAYAGDLGDRKGSLKDDGAYASSIWQGLYVGATAGYGWGTSELSLDRNDGNHDGVASNDPDGGLLGVTVGYNWRYTDRWIVGLEGDFSIADISGKDQKEVFDGHLWNSGWSSLVTLRGRVGYDLGSNLLYATAGLAMVNSDEFVAGNNPDESADNTGWRTGYALGFGVEHQFTDRLSGKIEYMHVGLFDNDGHDADGDPFTFQNDLDMIRVGVNYKIH